MHRNYVTNIKLNMKLNILGIPKCLFSSLDVQISKQESLYGKECFVIEHKYVYAEFY